MDYKNLHNPVWTPYPGGYGPCQEHSFPWYFTPYYGRPCQRSLYYHSRLFQWEMYQVGHILQGSVPLPLTNIVQRPGPHHQHYFTAIQDRVHCPQQTSSIIMRGQGCCTVYWKGARHYGGQITPPHKQGGTINTTLIPVPMLHQAEHTTELSKPDPPSSHPAHLKSCHCFGRPCTPGQMWHDYSCILLPPNPWRVNQIKVLRKTFSFDDVSFSYGRTKRGNHTMKWFGWGGQTC